MDRRCILEPLTLYPYSEVVWVGVWRGWLLCHAHVVADLVHQHGRVLTVWARGPRRQIVVVADALDNSLLGVEGHTLRRPGLGSTCR